jgi:hypothetical protein
LPDARLSCQTWPLSLGSGEGSGGRQVVLLLQLADPGLELLDELTECAIVGLEVDVARYAG